MLALRDILFVALACIGLSAAAPAQSSPLEWVAPDGTIVSGDLFLPSGTGRHPAIVLVSGSGRTPALERGFERRASRELSQRGFAVLSYDRRGTGASGGEFRAWTFDTLAADLSAGIEALAAHPRIDRDRIALIALSQGWWISLIAESGRPQSRLLIGIGAPTTTPDIQGRYAIETALADFDPAQVDHALRLYAQQSDVMRGDVAEADYRAALQPAMEAPWFEPVRDLLVVIPAESAFATWYRPIMDVDPLPLMRHSQSPMVLFSGGSDSIVSLEQTRSDVTALQADGIAIRLIEQDGDHDLSRRNLFGRRVWDAAVWDRLATILAAMGSPAEAHAVVDAPRE